MKNILVLDVGGTFIKYGLCDESLSLFDSGKISVAKSYDDFIASIKSIKDSLPQQILGASVALCGGYDFDNDKVFAPNLTLLNGKSIKHDLENALKVDVFVENDANLAALGEYVFSEKDSIKNMIFVTLGTGVGGGLILDGKLFSSGVTAFEIGHICVEPRGVLCGCGRTGCLDEYCSTDGLMRFYEKRGGKNASNPMELGLCADRSEKEALEAFEDYGQTLASALADCANLFCPQKIKIGGGLSELSRHYEHSLVSSFEKNVFPMYKGTVAIEVASLKNNAGMVGAGAYFFMNKN